MVHKKSKKTLGIFNRNQIIESFGYIYEIKQLHVCYYTHYPNDYEILSSIEISELEARRQIFSNLFSSLSKFGIVKDTTLRGFQDTCLIQSIISSLVKRINRPYVCKTQRSKSSKSPIPLSLNRRIFNTLLSDSTGRRMLSSTLRERCDKGGVRNAKRRKFKYALNPTFSPKNNFIANRTSTNYAHLV